VTAPIYRDAHGRFISLPPEARAKLDAMRGRPTFAGPGPIVSGVVKIKPEDVEKIKREWEAAAGPGFLSPLYDDAIYRPERKSWLERALTWFTWNRSRA